MRSLNILFLCCIFASSTALHSRDDDINLDSLMTLVQQQASTIQSQASTIQALENRVQALENSDAAQSRQLSAIDLRVGKQVAFSAHMNDVHVHVGDNSPFIFNTVVTNIGGCYNNHTGIFIAPYEGLYVFYFIMVNDGNAGTMHAAIEKDGVVLGMGSSDGVGNYNSFDDGSVLITTHLTKGDQVYVKRFDSGTSVYGTWFVNFSGFLLSADA